ncbi:hypothetical protein GCM10010264_72570 [Streptomyces globisporus]|nr:hypothetical protein GCM10010264_72570 [Streptomyces globisporus]
MSNPEAQRSPATDEQDAASHSEAGASAPQRRATRRKRGQLPDAGDEPIPGQTELPLSYRQVSLWSL